MGAQENALSHSRTVESEANTGHFTPAASQFMALKFMTLDRCTRALPCVPILLPFLANISIPPLLNSFLPSPTCQEQQGTACPSTPFAHDKKLSGPPPRLTVSSILSAVLSRRTRVPKAQAAAEAYPRYRTNDHIPHLPTISPARNEPFACS